MKWIKELFYDSTVVDNLNEAKINEGILYNMLYNGKITMAEYLKINKA